MTKSTKSLRCAIYTRKSTEEGLEQEYNTLDAQRDAGEAYIKSQQHEGWACLPDRYDDGGFTGANMERPALRRLLADIETGKVNCVVVYKVDRLSRSLLDFASIMATFEKHDIAFVSVTQAFNTASSMGRLVLNVLLSFAQFEREMISERTRDKIASARRKGKWSGGMPVLGYNVVDSKLVVDAVEASRVRQIFAMYLEQQSLLSVAKETKSRGWRTKRWETRKGTVRGGRVFDKGSLHQLLTNVAYAGKVKYKDEVHQGEYEPLIDEGDFQRVQELLRQNGRNGGRAVRNKHGALLRGILSCAACDCAMSHSFCTKGTRRYRYYVCTNAQKHGWEACPSPSVPAGKLEQFIVDEIRSIGRDPNVIKETLTQARIQTQEAIENLNLERSGLCDQLRNEHEELSRLTATSLPSDPKFADAHDRIRDAERRLTEVDDELVGLQDNLVEESEVAAALVDFDAVWASLTPREQSRVIHILVERVAYDGISGNVSITFKPTGNKIVANEVTQRREEAA